MILQQPHLESTYQGRNLSGEIFFKIEIDRVWACISLYVAMLSSCQSSDFKLWSWNWIELLTRGFGCSLANYMTVIKVGRAFCHFRGGKWGFCCVDCGVCWKLGRDIRNGRWSKGEVVTSIGGLCRGQRWRGFIFS